MLTVIVYIILLIYTLFFFVVFSVAFAFTVLFDKKRSVVHWLSWLWTKGYFALTPGWKIVREGLENVDRKKQYVVIVNHRSLFDIIMMYAVPLNFRWVSKKEVYRWPLFGWVLWMHGDIAIERGTASAVKKMIRESQDWIARGVSVMIFPEGSRSKVPHIGNFKEGAFLMAKSAGAEILPVVAEGTGTATKGWRINFRNKFKVRILPPVDAETVRKTPVKEMTERMQELMSREYEKLKEEVGNYR